ncbi:MAG: ATP-binding protein [Actinomycetales bacterium]|nr:ATP-binding protein [Actinomycetales bacterium]
MPRLIVINGPPGCGKSTLAARYVADHPLALDLDIDRVRGCLGRWLSTPQEAGRRARAIALASGRVHLTAGYDVVVPQYLGRTEFLEQLEEVADETGADFHEIVLMDTRENAVRRFVERARTSTEQVHLDARELVDRCGGVDVLAELYDRLLDVLAARPAATVLRIEEGRVDDTYRDLLAAVT